MGSNASFKKSRNLRKRCAIQNQKLQRRLCCLSSWRCCSSKVLRQGQPSLEPSGERRQELCEGHPRSKAYGAAKRGTVGIGNDSGHGWGGGRTPNTKLGQKDHALLHSTIPAGKMNESFPEVLINSAFLSHFISSSAIFSLFSLLNIILLYRINTNSAFFEKFLS